MIDIKWRFCKSRSCLCCFWLRINIFKTRIKIFHFNLKSFSRIYLYLIRILFIKCLIRIIYFNNLLLRCPLYFMTLLFFIFLWTWCWKRNILNYHLRSFSLPILRSLYNLSLYFKYFSILIIILITIIHHLLLPHHLPHSPKQ